MTDIPEELGSSWEDLRRRSRALGERLEREVFVDSGFICFDVDAVRYDVELSRCNTHEKILAWVLQLNEKTWIEPLHLERFILLAVEANRIPFDRDI